MTSAQLEHEIRLLKLYAAGLTVVVLVLAVSSGGTAQSQRQRFGEIDVERINVVDADGTLAFVLANRDRMPGPIMAGKELSPDLSQGRRGDAGMVFVDAQGNEVGGMLYGAKVQPDGRYTASGSLTFDQHNQDQVVGLQYADENGVRAYGLNVWDRPTKITLQETIAATAGITDRQAREAQVRKLFEQRGETVQWARRVFVGSQERTASVRLMDTAGKDRLRMTVDANNSARIEFLDDAGKIVYSLPPR